MFQAHLSILRVALSNSVLSSWARTIISIPQASIVSLFQEVRSVLFTEQNLLHSSACHKALLTPGCGEEKYSVHCRAEQEWGRAAHAQKSKTPWWHSGKGFSRQCERGLQGVRPACGQFSDSSRRSFKHPQPSALSQSRVYAPVVSSSHMIGVSFLQK